MRFYKIETAFYRVNAKKYILVFASLQKNAVCPDRYLPAFKPFIIQFKCYTKKD